MSSIDALDFLHLVGTEIKEHFTPNVCDSLFKLSSLKN